MRFGAAKTIYTQLRGRAESDLDPAATDWAASAPLQVRAAYAFAAPTPTMEPARKRGQLAVTIGADVRQGARLPRKWDVQAGGPRSRDDVLGTRTLRPARCLESRCGG